jgi:hypothetical protein
MAGGGLNGREAGGAGGPCISWYGQRRSVGVIVSPADIKVQTLILCGKKWGLQGLTLPWPLPISRYMGGHLRCYSATESNVRRKDKADNNLLDCTRLLTHGEDLQVARW